MEQLEYNDMLVALASYINQYGVRRVMTDFQINYPTYFDEVKVQINRLPAKPMAVLLRK